jgi:hypothetical protein
MTINAAQLTKSFLRVFIVSIIVTALSGIMAISAPGAFGWVEARILATTATIAGASVLGLSCGGCLTRGHRVLPTAGLILNGLAALLLLAGIWTEIHSELYWKSTASVVIFAVACAHLSMLFMANLAGGYRWTYIVAYQLIFGLAVLLVAAIFFELFERANFFRLVGVVSILVAAVTLLVPIFHYLSRDQFASERADRDAVFAVDEEIAKLKKRLMELEQRRSTLLGREKITGVGLPGGTGE